MLAFCFCVAGARGASGAGEDGQDVAPERIGGLFGGGEGGGCEAKEAGDRKEDSGARPVHFEESAMTGLLSMSRSSLPAASLARRPPVVEPVKKAKVFGLSASEAMGWAGFFENLFLGAGGALAAFVLEEVGPEARGAGFIGGEDAVGIDGGGFLLVLFLGLLFDFVRVGAPGEGGDGAGLEFWGEGADFFA